VEETFSIVFEEALLTYYGRALVGRGRGTDEGSILGQSEGGKSEI
jgi:hypothetical protein